MPKENSVNLFPLGLTAALLPLLTIHACLVLSIAQGHLDACNPYWLSCHSISATGRHGLAYFVFKGGMIPALVLLAIFWLINYRWLVSLRVERGKSLPWLGLIASIALIVYSLSLGHSGGMFYILRRAGVVTYLGLTFIAQAIFSHALTRCHQEDVRGQGKKLLKFCIFILSLALFTLVLDALPMVDYEPMEDMFEWILTVLLNIHALIVVSYWRKQNLQITFSKPT